MIAIPESLRKKKYPRWVREGESGFTIKTQEEHIKKAPKDYEEMLAELGLSQPTPMPVVTVSKPNEEHETEEVPEDDWTSVSLPAAAAPQRKGRGR